jgi:hypothetical protein
VAEDGGSRFIWSLHIHRRNLGGGVGGQVPPPIFFLPKIFFFQWAEEAQITVEMFSKRLIGWCKDRKKNVHFTGRRIEASEFLICLVDFAPILLVKLRQFSFPPLLDRNLKLLNSLRNFMPLINPTEPPKSLIRSYI